MWAYVSNSRKIEYNFTRSFNLEEYLFIFKINQGIRSFADFSNFDDFFGLGSIDEESFCILI